ncbi:MAG TPA: DUF2521 family protein [Bacilli bacterium]|nr:DUF2521 family protein [Bacilli bacterium]
MTVITTFQEKQREKRWKFERRVLRKVSLENIQRSVRLFFQPILSFEVFTHPYLIDQSLDIAVEAYLLGAEYSRFGYFGEDEKSVLFRCERELKELYEQLESYFHLWVKDDCQYAEYEAIVAQFLYHWWKKGYEEGGKGYRLRLH